MHNSVHLQLAPAVPVIFQRRQNDCAIACLAMIAEYFSLTSHYEHSLPLRDSDKAGLTIGEMVVLADTLGLSTSTHRPDCNALRKVTVPSILHWRNNHFVVLVKASANGVIIHDPEIGMAKMTWHEVRSLYSGVCIEFSMSVNNTACVAQANYRSREQVNSRTS